VSSNSTTPYRVSFESAAATTQLAEEWQAITRVRCESYFQSWGWNETWLHELAYAGHSVELARITQGNATVGLALIAERSIPRHRVLRSRAALLFATGMTDADSIAYEYNQILCLPGHEAAVCEALLKAVATGRRAQELQIAAVDGPWTERFAQAARACGIHPLVRYTKPAFAMDLAALRAAKRDPLEHFSSNTRQQVRRAMRGFETTGKLAVTRPNNLEEARALFAEFASVHTAHWQKKSLPGAFGSEFQRRFHARLLEARFASGEIDLVRIDTGDKPVGYLYNFVLNGVAGNYQTAFAYDETDSKLKPGMVCHTLMMQNYLARGLDKYDLLMGEQRYKRSLSSHEVRLSWLALHRSRIRYFLDRYSGAVDPP
jgi:CelD/BcsL family acetyltransferase involved in cellulose biosynthesis